MSNELTHITVYTVNDVAKMLRIDHQTVRRYIKAGKIKAIRFSGNIRIAATEIDYLLEKGQE